MNTKEYLQFLQKDIHSTAMATIGSDGHPQARIIDIMLADDTCLYFITAKGKEFYRQLTEQKYIALTGMNQKKQAISLRGRIRSADPSLLEKVFEENSYMKDIYPQQESRSALEVFCIYEGQGEFFDLSCTPIFRDTFVLGNAQAQKSGYFVQATCIGCKLCYSVCPQKCIDIAEKPAVIQQEHCLHCGRCEEICPVHAVQRIGG
jgi:uncharacterized pyridoxamine 5'-phosphate oxidase family protein/NAD-dependent dihydropyrimidine dehydrogenase PreA subunit